MVAAPRMPIAEGWSLDQHGRILTTYSSWKLFRGCRRAYFYKYFRRLVKTEVSLADPRTGGDILHGALERYYELGARHFAPEIFAEVARRFGADPDQPLALAERDHDAFEAWRRTAAMLRGYSRRWQADDSEADRRWEIVLLEQRFTSDITNPDTGEVNPRFAVGGKVDGVVRLREPAVWGGRPVGPGLYLLEHKTASSIDAAYIERLWADFQILEYAHYVEDGLGEPIVGVLYNVIGKARLEHDAGETAEAYYGRCREQADAAERGELGRRLRLRQGEDEDNFKRRRIEAGREEVAKLMQRPVEPVEAYDARLDDWYSKPEAFERVALAVDPRAVEDMLRQLWANTIEHGWAEQSGVWGKNDAHCYAYGRRPCDYVDLCRSFEDPRVLEENYRLGDPHAELSHPALPVLND